MQMLSARQKRPVSEQQSPATPMLTATPASRLGSRTSIRVQDLPEEPHGRAECHAQATQLQSFDSGGTWACVREGDNSFIDLNFHLSQ